MRCDAGTRTSSKTTSPVGDARSPILSSCLGNSTPQSFSTRKHVMPWLARGRIGAREDGVGVRHAGVGDPVLRAVQDVVVAVAHRATAHRRDVGPGVGLGEAVTRLDLARGDARQVRLLELLGGEVHDRQHAELRDQHRHRRRRASARELLGHDRLGHHVGAGAAVGLGDLQRRQVHLRRRRRSSPGGRSGRDRSARRAARSARRRSCACTSRKARCSSVRSKLMTAPSC